MQGDATYSLLQVFHILVIFGLKFLIKTKNVLTYIVKYSDLKLVYYFQW